MSPSSRIVTLDQPVTLLACHFLGEFGSPDGGCDTGVFTTREPYEIMVPPSCADNVSLYAVNHQHDTYWWDRADRTVPSATTWITGRGSGSSWSGCRDRRR